MNAQENSKTEENAKNDGTEFSDIRRALPQFLAVGVKNILLFGYGLTIGFPTIVIPAIQGGEGRETTQQQHDLILSKDEISWFSSINLLCVPLGCVFSGIVSQPIGKRMAMQLVNIPILISWLLFHFSTNIYFLYAGLCLSGLSGGLMEAPVLTYVAEVTQPKFRGMLAASGSTCVILGVFSQFLFGTITNWRTISAICTIFPVISIITLFFIPESPYWLLTKGRLNEAQKSLAWLRGWIPVEHIQTEFNEMRKVLIERNSVKFDGNENDSPFVRQLRLYTKKSFLVPYALVTLTFFIGHFSGKTALQTYAVQIFHTLKAPIDKYYATVLLGAAELIGTIICVILVHFTGKRPLVIISAVGCGFCFLGTATYARFLYLVPGVTVDNVVANVSALDLNKSNIISALNVTAIIKMEEDQQFALKNNNVTSAANEKSLYNFNAISNYYGNALMNGKLDDAFSNEEQNSNETIDEDFVENFTFMLEYTTAVTEILPDINDYSSDATEKNETVQDELKTGETQHIMESVEMQPPESIVLKVSTTVANQYLWMPLTLLLMGALFAHIGLRLIPWMLIGEVFPVSVRSGASGLSGGTGYVFGFLANKLFLKMLATLTLPGTFWCYSVVGLSGALILYFVLPETEGRSLIEIEEHFSGGKSLNPVTYIKSSPVTCDSVVKQSGECDVVELTDIDNDVNVVPKCVQKSTGYGVNSLRLSESEEKFYSTKL